jgi:hypothetical protein
MSPEEKEKNRLRMAQWDRDNPGRKSEYMREDRKKNPDKYHERDRIRYKKTPLLSASKNRAKAKGLEHDLDRQWLLDHGVVDGEGVCELSGIKGSVKNKQDWDSLSIDRIDNTKGYTKGNCRIVLWCLNAAFSHWGEEVFAQVAQAWLLRRGLK